MKDALGHGSNARGGGKKLFKPIPNHPYHAKPDAELRYIIKDASEAAKASQSMGKLETKYNDQVNDAATVLGYRDRGGKQDAPGHGLIEGMQAKLSSDVAAGRMLSSGTPKSNAAPVHDSMVGAKGANGHYIVPGGQGHDPSHASSPLSGAAMAKGYSYSHSTPIHMQDGSVQMHHTYASGEHKVGVSGNKWETSVSSGSGHRTRGTGAESLSKHLASKASRYPGLRR